MTNRIHSVTFWSIEIRPTGVYVIESESKAKPTFKGPSAPSKNKWQINSWHGSVNKTNEYGPINVTNTRQFVKSPLMTDLEFTDTSGEKYIASRGNKNNFDSESNKVFNEFVDLLKKN